MKTKLHSLKIKDELQGRFSENPQYLFYSVQKDDDLQSSHASGDAHMETPLGHVEDDDAFTDALPEFGSITDYSPRLGTPCAMKRSDPSEGETVEGFQRDDWVQGKGVSEIFYEAHGGESSDFVSVVIVMRNSTSPSYDGIDTQVGYPT